MIINLVLDPTAQAAPPDIKAAWTTAANILDAAFSDIITINLDVTYGVANGKTGSASASPSAWQSFNYNDIANLLTTNASPGDASFSGLPSSTTIQGQPLVVVWNAQLKALGIGNVGALADDGNADFGTGIAASDMISVALHEFTHAMGRVPTTNVVGSGRPNIFDLFRFTNQNTRLFTDSNTAVRAYFSLNNGFSEWAEYGQTSDASDTLNSSSLTTDDAFNERYSGNAKQYLTPFDLEQMDVLGFHPTHPFNVDSSDFNGDNSGDILVQDFSTGAIAYLNMANGSPNGWVGVATTPGWFVVGQGKITGGRSSDVVIENQQSGDIWYANMGNNGTFSNWVNYNANIGGGSWHVLGVGDINGDFHADIVVQDSTTGVIDYARTASGGALDQWVGVATTPGWTVVGTGDVNGDGFADIVIQNNITGQIDYADMANGVFQDWHFVATTPGFNVVGVGDIDRNGSADIVVENFGTGEIGYYKMKTADPYVAIHDKVLGYRVIGVEDILANGFNDIVIQQFSGGKIQYADMTLGNFNNWVDVANTPGWTGVTRPEDAGIPVALSDPGPQNDTVPAPVPVAMFDPGPQNNNVPTPVSMLDPGEAVTPVRMFDPGPQGGNGPIAVSMFDPGPTSGGVPGPVSMFDPGPLGSDTPSAVHMFDPGPISDNIVAAVSMFDPGPQSENVPTPAWMIDPGPQGDTVASSLFTRA